MGSERAAKGTGVICKTDGGGWEEAALKWYVELDGWRGLGGKGGGK